MDSRYGTIKAAYRFWDSITFLKKGSRAASVATILSHTSRVLVRMSSGVFRTWTLCFSVNSL
jgi:hypothetical protein